MIGTKPHQHLSCVLLASDISGNYAYTTAFFALLHRMRRVRICASIKSLSRAKRPTQTMMTQIGMLRRRDVAISCDTTRGGVGCATSVL